MATISSVGIGSGLDANGIIAKLVALEKQPLKALATRATNIQSQISAFGQVQSQFSALADVASRISDATRWSARSASSSNTGAATITAANSANATSFSLDIDALALRQSVSSPPLTAGAALGAGTLSLQLGTWASAGTSFTPGSGSAAVVISVGAADTVADIANKINAAGAGVIATTFKDGTHDRLLLQSKGTGEATGFRVQSGDAALAPLVFDPQGSPGVGMATTGIPVQYGQNAKARINGLPVTSATNLLSDNIPGVTINLLSTTTTGYGTVGEVKSPAIVAISEDVTPSVKNIQDFVAAYNTLNQSLTDLTRYDASTKSAGLFQGDATVVGMQNVLRSMIGSASLGSTSQRLSDVGIQTQRDGSLTINTSKLSTAANNGTSLQQLFTKNNGNPLTNGFALKFKTLAQGVLATGGSVTNETSALQRLLAQNSAAQTKVNDRAAVIEARLKTQYSALDAQMGSLNALSAYVTQQVTLWNKNTA